MRKRISLKAIAILIGGEAVLVLVFAGIGMPVVSIIPLMVIAACALIIVTSPREYGTPSSSAPSTELLPDTLDKSTEPDESPSTS